MTFRVYFRMLYQLSYPPELDRKRMIIPDSRNLGSHFLHFTGSIASRKHRLPVLPTGGVCAIT